MKKVDFNKAKIAVAIKKGFDSIKLENGENKYYCLGSSGCVHDDKTFYNVIYVDNKNVEIKAAICNYC